MSPTQGFDLSVPIAADRPTNPTDLAVLADDTVYLAEFDLSVNPFSVFASGLYTLTVAEAVAAGMSLSVDLAADDWEPSQVTGATIPTGTGTPYLTGALPALAAGDQVVLDLTTLMGDVLSGATVDRGIRIQRLDAGAAAKVWSFNAVDETLQPSWTPIYALSLPVPTNMSPRDGKIVSASQVLIRVKDYAVGLGDIALASMRVQWANTAGGTVVADDTLPVTAPQFPMWDAPSGFDLTSIYQYYRVQLTSVDGVDSPWGAWTSTRFVANPSLAITNPAPAPGNVSADPDPLVAWVFGGTQTKFELIRSPLTSPSTVMNPPSTRGWITSTAASAVVGAELLDSSSARDRLRVKDNLDREDVPGAPAYSEAEVVWSVDDDASLRPPELLLVEPLTEDSPFLRIRWRQPNSLDFRVRANGVNISGLLHGDDIQVGEDEEGLLFEWIWLGASPNVLYTFAVQNVTDHRGSLRSDPISVLTSAISTWLANQITGRWLEMFEVDFGEWVRAEPTSAWYNQISGDGLYRRSRGIRLAYSTRMTAELWPDDATALTVNAQQRAFDTMCNTDDELRLVTPHEALGVKIAVTSSTPLDDPFERPRKVAMEVRQTGASSLVNDPPDAGQVVTTLIDFESYTEGAAVTTSDPSGLIFGVPGTVEARAAAAAHGSTRGARLKDVSGGSNLRISVNPLNNEVDYYFPLGIPGPRSSDFNVHKWPGATSGSACSVRMATAGSFEIDDSTTTRLVHTIVKAKDGVPLRLTCSNRWVDGRCFPRVRGYIGLNVEGTNPDFDMTPPNDAGDGLPGIPTPAAPDDTVQIGPTTTFGFGDINIDDIRVVNSAAVALEALGEPAGGTLAYAHSSAMTNARIITQAVGIGVVDHVKLAYSTTVDSLGRPASPSFGPLVAVNGYGCARLTATSLASHTGYYYAVADSAGTIFGPTGFVKTLYAPNTAGSYNMGQWSCQTGGDHTTSEAWANMATYAPDIMIGQGDTNYPGGSYSPTTPVQKHIDKTYTGQYARIPLMELCLRNGSVEDQVDDHEVCGNGQYESSPGVYGPWSDQLAIFQASILAVPQARPVEYADTAPTPRGRYYFKDLFKNKPSGGTSVRLFMLDNRTMDRSDGRDLDGPAKTFLGAPQIAWLSANLLSSGLNILSMQSTMYVAASDNLGGNIDKWANFFWELTNVLAPMLAGKPCDWLAGDRHGIGFLDHTQNPILPGVDVMLASAMEQHGLGLNAGELYKDAGGVTRTFGFTNDPDNPNRQYGRYVVADNNAGTITRTWTPWNARTDSAPFGPFTRTFTY